MSSGQECEVICTLHQPTFSALKLLNILVFMQIDQTYNYFNCKATNIAVLDKGMQVTCVRQVTWVLAIPKQRCSLLHFATKAVLTQSRLF